MNRWLIRMLIAVTMLGLLSMVSRWATAPAPVTVQATGSIPETEAPNREHVKERDVRRIEAILRGLDAQT